MNPSIFPPWFQWFAALLGVAGGILGVVNFIWQWRLKVERLRMTIISAGNKSVRIYNPTEHPIEIRAVGTELQSIGGGWDMLPNTDFKTPATLQAKSSIVVPLSGNEVFGLTGRPYGRFIVRTGAGRVFLLYLNSVGQRVGWITRIVGPRNKRGEC